MGYTYPPIQYNPNLFAKEVEEAEKLGNEIVDILRANGVNLQFDNKIISPISTKLHFNFGGYDWKTNNIRKVQTNIKNFECMIGKQMDIRTVPNERGLYIECANFDREIIPLGNVIKSARDLGKLQKPTEMCLGFNGFNEPIVIDIAECPHVLIAGETRAGKSVLLKSIIMSFLQTAIPNEMQFVLIDPKRTGLNAFEGLDNFKYTTYNAPNPAYDTNDAMRLLRSVRRDMEARNKKFQEEGVVDIEEFNKKIIKENKVMSYIVVVIDELAELIKYSKNEIENIIGSLASLGRSTGIHLIAATQRPDATQLSTSIRSNLPYRIGLRTDSSRMIIGQKGCENLLGNGDGYYKDLDRFAYERFQSAYVDTNDITKAVNYINEEIRRL